MKVIMLQNVKGVGQKDAIVDVAAGYALNALIPSGKAREASPSQLQALAKRNAAKAEASARKNDAAHKIIESLKGGRVVVKARANDQGALFRGITQRDIAAALTAHAGVDVDPALIGEIEAPIKRVGEYTLSLSAGGLRANVRMVVEPQDRRAR